MAMAETVGEANLRVTVLPSNSLTKRWYILLLPSIAIGVGCGTSRRREKGANSQQKEEQEEEEDSD